MSTAVQIEPPKAAVVGPSRAGRLGVILADGSNEYMKIVVALLNLHERIELIGRAANFSEATRLVVNHSPDLLVLDLDMHSKPDCSCGSLVFADSGQDRWLAHRRNDLFPTAGVHNWGKPARSPVAFPAGIPIDDQYPVRK